MTTRSLTSASASRTAAEEISRLLAADDRDLVWLAKKTTYSQSHLWRVIHEGRRVSTELAELLAALFDVPASTFLPESEAE